MSDIKTASFGEMVKAAIGGPGAQVLPGVMASHDGGSFKIPLDTAAITASNIGGRELVVDGVEWLAGDASESPIMGRLNVLAVSQTRGKIASGRALPATSLQAERLTAALGRGVAFPVTPAPTTGDLFRFLSAVTGIVAVDEAGVAITEAARDSTFRYNGAAWQRQAAVFGEFDYELSSTIEAKSEVSMQLAMQAGDFALEAVLESHRISISDTLLAQVLAGDGLGNNLSGVVNASGIAGGTYVVADRGKSSSFQDAEDAIEDAGARGPFMAWAAGADLSTSARRVAIEPGGSRRTEERGRLTLSGAPVQRITTGLAATTGLCADWRAVTVPVLDQLAVVVDRQTLPGDLRITSRLPVADPIVTHPATAYKLTQA